MALSMTPETQARLQQSITCNAAVILRTHPGADREELIAEGWLGAAQAIAKYDARQRCSLTTYADRRIRGAMLDYLRREYGRQHRRKIRLMPWPEKSTGAADNRMPNADKIDVHRLIANLPARSQAIVLARMEDRTFTEIAGEIGCSPAAAQQSYHRALVAMRQAAA